MNWRHGVGIAFLGLQLLAIIHARFVPERFFCWGPYDEHSRYWIDVTIDGKPLPAEEISERYRYESSGWEVRRMRNVISIVRQYETSYGHADNALVTVSHEVNGRPLETWIWPEP
jgi:hypothetical protein